MIKQFIDENLIPELDAVITDGDLRKIIYQTIEEAEKAYEDKNEDDIRRILSVAFGYPGVMLDGSKRDKNTIYNANIVINKKKLWYGDFRLYNKIMLNDIATLVGADVYLLREMDARFDTEEKPRLENAVCVGKSY